MNAELIDEGKDVYLKCEIEANPKVYKIIIRHNKCGFIVIWSDHGFVGCYTNSSGTQMCSILS